MKRGVLRALMTDNGAAMFADGARSVDRFLETPSVLRANPSADKLRLAFTAET